METKKKHGGKREGAGAPLLGDKKRVEIKTTIDESTKNTLETMRSELGKSIGLIIDGLVK